MHEQLRKGNDVEPKNRLNDDEDAVRHNISRVRRRPGRLRDKYVTLAHGAGGKASSTLVDKVFYAAYGNNELSASEDAAVGSVGSAHLAMSTDSYVVNPVFFPGGSIGELAVNGTVNDLAVSGAQPQWLSISYILEEGLPIADLRRVAEDVARAADTAGIKIVTGDTKVVPKGAGDQVYITTAGVGLIPEGRTLSYEQIEVGDTIVVSGPIADHGMAVMLARGDLALEAEIRSDTREISSQVEALFDAGLRIKWLRDATRGGLATVLNELAEHTGHGVVLKDEAIPVRPTTRAACDVLGIDPLYVANEGTFIAVVAAEDARRAAEILGNQAAPIGKVSVAPAASVALVTGFGGARMVDKLVGDPLPRIC